MFWTMLFFLQGKLQHHHALNIPHFCYGCTRRHIQFIHVAATSNPQTPAHELFLVLAELEHLLDLFARRAGGRYALPFCTEDWWISQVRGGREGVSWEVVVDGGGAEEKEVGIYRGNGMQHYITSWFSVCIIIFPAASV
jgi:hypothetical protein